MRGLIPWLTAMMLLCGLVAAGIVAAREIGIRRIAVAAAAAARPGSAADRDRQARALADCADNDNERALIPCIAGQATLARRATSADARATYRMRGSRAEARLIDRVPGSGEAHAASALLHSIDDDPREQSRAVAALAESYRRAPFLRSAGLWRLWWGGNHWNLAAPALRRAVLEEALWLGSLSGADREAVLRALAGTPAYVPIALRLPGQPGEGMPLPH